VRILIVEDDVDASAAMCTGLGEAGHTCQTAPDGEDGWSPPAPATSTSWWSTG
jgi:DNA-binding response OmpR family regulator